MESSSSRNNLVQPSESEATDNEEEILDNNYRQESDVDVPATVEPENSLTRNPPEDRYNFSYSVFYLLGMSTLIPWNFMITAEQYWMYKFRDAANASDNALTPIQKSFTSDFCVASAIPTTLFLILNAFLGHYIALRIRMIGSMFAIIVLFILTTAFVEVDTDGWQSEFFILTIATIVAINTFAAIISGGLLGIAGLFPSEYMTAIVSGQALGGIFAALAQIICLTFGTGPKTTAFIYFTIATVVIIISLIAYHIMSRTKFFQYFVQEQIEYPSSQSLEQLNGDVAYVPKPNIREVFRKISVHAFSVWFVFVVTLSVYPSVTVLMESQDAGNHNLWNDKYFTPTVNYLLFNSGDYFGRIIAGIFESPRRKPQVILLLTIARTFFIPILMMGNTPLHKFLPTLIHSDLTFIIIMLIFALTNGYIANMALIMAPKAVMHHEKETASSIMAAAVGVGLAIGSTSSLILVQLL